ncbi:MAG: NADP-dependent phosphogluconate dehydrogenase [Bacteroidota bacterium]|nr:NADP-dependent phosphogluconate dehydrogenase [Bacteroidota bacterium]
MEKLSEFGLIGLGVMGKSLALNLAGKGISVSIFNRHVAGKEEGIAKAIVEENPSLRNIKCSDDLRAFVNSLARPRKILLMITAGPAVDHQLEALLPMLDKGDVVIDGGNSYYKDTARRTAMAEERGFHFVGTGISGGKEGALKGPSLMPGGSKEGYALISHYLELIAAKDKNGEPCTTYIGPKGAGHFSKMVHNSIEYAEMQVLAEAYHLMRDHVQLTAETIARTFQDWQQSGLDSYLLEITIDILLHNEDGELLLDKILDQAEQKGTGGWSVGAALEYGVPYSPLTEAVTARSISARKQLRQQAAALYKLNSSKAEDADPFMASLKNAYQATRIINHAVGFDLIRAASEKHGWGLNFSEIARIWTNGCIIRSEFMQELVDLFADHDQLLLAPSIADRLQEYQKDLRYVVAQGLQAGFALPVSAAALNYLLGLTTADSPANLIQAQRDYFGAHTYQRRDRGAAEYFHTQWKKGALD